MQIHHALTLAADSGSPGPGPIMRSVIVIAVVGVVLIAWLVLRGYRN
jgi:hypothetical protein